MKTKLILTTFFLFVITAPMVIAQNASLKIGYTDPEYILSLLPKYKEVESELRSYEKQLQSQLESKMKEYQVKLEAYQKDISTMPDIIKQDKERELIGMQNNIKEFEENAMAAMQKKQSALLDPLIQVIYKAIDQVAEENGYTYIFSSTGGNSAIILYAKNKDEDISNLVLKKLGVTPPAKPEGTTGTTNTTTTDPVKPANTGTTTTNPTTTAPVKKK
jgi:outer membrane protein